MGKSFFIIVFALNLLSLQSQAQQMCVDLFSTKEAEPSFSLLPRDLSAIQNFETLRENLAASRTVKEANETIVDFVMMANRMMDQATDNIMMARLNNTPEELRSALFQSSQIMLAVLESGLRVPYEALERGLILRIESILQVDLNSREEALLRQEIGFYKGSRPKSYETEAPVKKSPLGFTNKSSDAVDAPADKAPIGFVHHKSESAHAEQGPHPIGFLPSKPTDGPVEKAPIGFVHFDPKGKDPIIYKITYDIEKGEFDFYRPGQKIGF